MKKKKVCGAEKLKIFTEEKKDAKAQESKI